MKNNKIQNRGKQALALSMLMMSLSILSPNVASKNIDSFMKLGPTKAFAATMPNVLNEEAKNYNTSLIPILPVMDSTLNKDGIKITSSSAKSDLYKIFDGDIKTGVYSVPRELNIEFDKPTQIDAMTVLGIKGRAADYTVKVEASNDGKLWESLATDKYVTTYYENNIPVFGIDQNKAGAYKHYRFTFSSSWGLDMAEMQFYSKGNAKQPINLTPLMPAMSSLDQDGIKLTASGSTAKDLYKIFDGDAKTSLYSTPGTFTVEFPKATQIDALSMVSAPSRGASYTVSIEGSNDGRLWSSIAQGLKYSPGDNANNQTVLDIPQDKTGSYKFYRFKVQNLWSLDVAEMQFYSKGNPKQQIELTPILPVMDSTLNKDGVKITSSSAKSDLYKIFDGDINTGVYSVPRELNVEFDKPTQIDAMTVLGIKGRAADYTVKVEASNDGKLWESLATDKYVTTYEENNIPMFEIAQSKAGAYKHYRFTFTSSWGLDMVEMQFYSKGNTKQVNLTPLMPAMGSLDQNGVKLTASGSNAKDLYKIFDGDAKTSLYSTPGTFTVEFPKATQVDALSMVSAPSRGASYTVSIEGSNDGKLWSSIAQGLKYSPGDNANNQSVLDIPEDRTGSYKFYRFKVQNLWSLDVAEMQLYSKGNPKQQVEMTPILPVMDSTLNKNGIKITPNSTKSDLYKIFDGDIKTGVYSVPRELNIEFDKPTQIDAMTVLGIKGRAADYTVKVEASNDGKLWDSLTTGKYVTTYYENDIPVFEIDQNKAGAYKHYRFTFSSSWGLDMAEMQFYSYGQGSSENSAVIIADEKLDKIESIIGDLTTQEKIDNAEASLDEVRGIIDSITNPDIKTELEERYEKIVEAIDEAKAIIKVEEAENKITQDAVDAAKEQVDKVKDSDTKTSLEDRLEYVQDVIDSQTEVDELDKMLEEYKKDLVSSDLTSDTEIVDLKTKLNKIKDKHKVVKEKTEALEKTEKESLNKRINDILDQLKNISNTVDTIDQILDEAADGNYRASNGNAEYRTKAARGTITDLLAMYNEEIETRIGLGNLSWLSINSELATVDQNGNMKAIKNGIAKITVFNENGYINFYFVVSNSAK